MTTGWAISEGLVGYPEAVAAMESRAAAIAAGEADELIWLLEHPPLYTKGASAQDGDLLDPTRFPVFDTQRGGQFTYHGPGQRVAYVMLDLTKRGRDVKQFVCSLEDWIIQTLGAFNVKGERRKGRVGVWIERTRSGGALREDKIAAIGVRLKRWVSYHGISLNVEPDLSHFGGITPCGISESGLGVTSITDLGRLVTMHEADMALKAAFEKVFGPVERVAPPL
jgi:lipoyl(octanoyl) transferase